MQRILDREIREWEQQNETLRIRKPGYVKQLVHSLGRNPVRSVAGATLFFVSILLLATSYSELINATSAPTPELHEKILDQCIALWGVQATLVALVYPIVIALVSLLLQRRHSSKASFHIYLHETAAITTGTSAIVLIILISLELVLNELIQSETLRLWFYVNSLWFVANMIGVSWFLLSTFRYLRPDIRKDVVLQYSINEVLKQEIRVGLFENHFYKATKYGHLPASTGNEETEQSVMMMPPAYDYGKVEVVAANAHGKYLCDVRFWLLRYVINSWTRRIDRNVRSRDENGQLDGLAERSPVLMFPFPSRWGYDRSVGLCRIQGAEELTKLERRLVEKSFVFTNQPVFKGVLRVEDVFEDLLTEARSAMEITATSYYREVLQEIIELHSEVINACSFLNDNSEPDNFSELVIGAGVLFAQSLNQEWIRLYRYLLEGCAAKLDTDSSYFEHASHIANRILVRTSAPRVARTVEGLLGISTRLDSLYNDWFCRCVESQGDVVHTAFDSKRLAPPKSVVAERVKAEFVGAWESIKNDIVSPDRGDIEDWKHTGHFGGVLCDHLNHTVIMLLRSLGSGDRESAVWMTDSTVKWWNQMRYRLQHVHWSMRDDRFLTVGLLVKSWEEACQYVDMDNWRWSETDALIMLFGRCVRNYWIDVCTVCASMIIDWCYGKVQGSFPLGLASSLVSGKSLKRGSDSPGLKPSVQGADDLFVSMMRQRYIDGGYAKGYRANLDALISRMSSIGDGPFAPGRVLDDYGMGDLESITNGQLVLLCAYVNVNSSPERMWAGITLKCCAVGTVLPSEVLGEMNNWILRLERNHFVENYRVAYDYLAASNNEQEPNFSAKIRHVASALRAVCNRVESSFDEKIAGTDIDEGRLLEIAEWCSRSGFTKSTAVAPVSLFDSVTAIDSGATYGKKYFIRKLERAEFTDPLMAQPPSNQDNWFDNILAQHVAKTVTDALRDLMRLSVLDTPTQERYIEALRRHSERILQKNETPVLFVRGYADPNWLVASTGEDEEMPLELRLSRRSSSEDRSFLGELNGVRVYIAPVQPGTSCLISMESLKQVSFASRGENVFVTATALEIQDPPTRIDLQLDWGFSVDVDGEVICLRYSNE